MSEEGGRKSKKMKCQICNETFEIGRFQPLTAWMEELPLEVCFKCYTLCKIRDEITSINKKLYED